MVFIPEIKDNVGWRDFAGKISKFLLENKSPVKETIVNIKGGSYAQVSQIEGWPNDEIRLEKDDMLEPNKFHIDANSLRSRVDFHQRCLLGSFRDESLKPPSQEDFQNWATKSWKLPQE